MNYNQFLENKVVKAQSYGFKIDRDRLPEILLNHQKDIIKWSLEGGRRACFASFGLGKTVMQLGIAQQVIKHTKKPFLIGLPLGVVGEFKRDNKLLNTGVDVEYITDTGSFSELKPIIYLTNYARIRKGDIEASKFGGVSFDEASVLRNLNTETTNYVLKHFGKVPYRFVFTATPTPNNFKEILNYAEFLGVIDRGQALTQFFKRDPKKAGNLKINETQKDEFWKWVSTWAVFINKPSDLGYNDDGYDLPKMHIHEIEVEHLPKDVITNKKGDIVLFKDNTKSLLDTAREKRDSIDLRVNKAFEIVNESKGDNFILWHHLEAERQEIERKFKIDFDLKSVYGSQKNELKEDLLIDFSNKKYQILATKPKIAGSGCNFQHACNKAVFVGIDYKFNDFIQAVHRIYRFKQTKEVHIFIIHTQNEHEVLKELKEKWRRHIELQTEMTNLVRNYGLNNDKMASDIKRKIFNEERHSELAGAKVWNQDCVKGMDYIEENSTGLIVTSIPFGDHYEYSDNYNDFGHNINNDKFFEQMEYLIPKLYKSLMPGRVCAVHVKDRIRYGYQKNISFTSIDDFSGQTVRVFTKEHVKNKIQMLEAMIEVSNEKEDAKYIKKISKEIEKLKEDYKDRFHLFGKITVPTDVVQENNQTYRLTWGELRKDSTKIGCGLPEYILLFRKAPTDGKNAYADLPVSKTKEEYTLAKWQLDAHAIWQSNGNRFLTLEQANELNPKTIYAWWKEYCRVVPYDYDLHVEAGETLEKAGKLSKKMMTLMNRPNSDGVMNDVNRLRTLNANQANRKKEKHICPLQLDIIERLIHQYSNEGEIVGDPFGGLFSTAYTALKMKRKAWAFELNSNYYDDGLHYLKSIEYELTVPTLFDLI